MQGKLTLTLLSAALSAAFISTPSVACTSVVVGKGASADGAVIISRNEDYYVNNWNKRLVIHPRRTADKGEMISFTNGLKVPAPAIFFRYTGMTDWNGDTTAADGPYEERGVNEYNLAISATNSLDVNAAAQKADPLVATGVIEADIPTLVLPQAKTARDAITLLGNVIKDQGAGEGNGILFADQNEAWYMEIGGGHEWIAVRVPQDKYLFVANGMRIHDVDLSDTANVMASPGLADFVRQNHLLAQVDEKHFNFAKAFGDTGDSYNVDREWMGEHLLSPSVQQPVRADQYPLFMTPDHKISVKDIASVLRATFTGTPLAQLPDATRPMGVDRTIETHIFEVRSNMPDALKTLTWQSFGSPTGAVLVPMYENTLREVPEVLRSGSDSYDGQSAYWAFRINGTLTETNPAKYAPIMADWQNRIEGTFQAEVPAVDSMLKHLYQQNPDAALGFANQWSNGNMLWAVQSAHDVNQTLLTDMTKTTEPKYAPDDLDAIKAL